MLEEPRDEIDPDEINSRIDLGLALTHVRDKARMTIREVSARTKISVSTLSGYYSGKHLPQVHPPGVLRSILRVCGVSDEAIVERWDRALVRVRRRPGRTAADTPSPYLGLACYQPEHADWFYGRDRLVDVVLARLTENHRSGHGPLFVIGTSGSGKSSLLRAGVIPAVGQGRLNVPTPREWRWLLMSPGTHPCQELADQFADVVDVVADDVAAAARHSPTDATSTLRRSLTQTNGETGLLLVVDQFEELFTRCGDDRERIAFIDTLCALAEPGGDTAPILVILGMRADFYPQASSYPRLVGVLQDSQVVISPMTDPELRSAIVGPAVRAGLSVEPGLVEVLLRDLASSRLVQSAADHDPGVLPLLSHALLATWERRQRGLLTIRSYQESGGIQEAVAASADRVYALLDEACQDLARILFLRLVHVNDRTADARQRVPFDELPKGDSDAETAKVVDRFVAERLLTVGVEGVEITHDALILAWPRLRDWIDADRLGQRQHRQLIAAAQTWQESEQDPTVLYRGTRLTDTLAWAGELSHARWLNQSEREFLNASSVQRAAEQRTARRRSHRRLAVGAVVAVLALFTSVLVGYVAAQHRAAMRERDVAQSVELAEQANLFRGSDASLSMQLALAAYRISPTPQARASLLDSVALPAGTRLVGSHQVLQSVAVAPGGRLLAAGGADRAIQLWDLTDRRRPTHVGPSLAGPTDTVYSVAFSPDGRLLAEGGADRVVRLWNVTRPAHPVLIGSPLTGPANTVYSVAFSPNGRILAAGGADDTIHLWDLSDPAHPERLGVPLTGAGDYVHSVAFSPDGRLLAAGSSDQTVRLWNLADPAKPSPVCGPLTGAINTVFAVAFSADGRTLAEGGADLTVRLWNVSDPAHPTLDGTPLTGATGWINAIAFSADGNTLAVASSDNVVRLWDIRTTRVIETLPHPGPVTGLAFFDQDHTLATSAADGVVRLWSLPGPVIGDRNSTVFSLSYAAHGTTLAVSSGSAPNTVELWDTRNSRDPVRLGPPVTDPPGDSPFAGSLGLSPDARTLAIGSRDGSIQLWDVSDTRHPTLIGRPLVVGAALVESLQFSPDGTVLATGGDDHLVRLWDVRHADHPRLLATLSGPANYVYGLAFSADGHVLAGGSADDKTWLWDVTRPAQPRRLPSLTGFSSYVFAVSFSPHGRVLAAGSADRTVRLWDLTDPDHPVALGTPLTGATNYVYSVAFSPDGRTLIVGSFDHRVLMWDVSNPRTPTLLESLAAAGDSIFVVSVSPDGRTLAAGTAEKAVRLWTIDPGRAAAEVCDVAGDPITRQEWTQYVPNRPYQPPC